MNGFKKENKFSFAFYFHYFCGCKYRILKGLKCFFCPKKEIEEANSQTI